MHGIEEEHPAIIALLNAMPVSYHSELRKWFKEWIAQVNVKTIITALVLERGGIDLKAAHKKRALYDLGLIAMELSAVTTENNHKNAYGYRNEFDLEITYESLVIRKRPASEDKEHN